jgi:hypothetical protein
LCYRVVVYELDGGEQTESVIMDAEGEAFQAAVGSLHDGRMIGERGVGGPANLRGHLADLIADSPLRSTR